MRTVALGGGGGGKKKKNGIKTRLCLPTPPPPPPLSACTLGVSVKNVMAWLSSVQSNHQGGGGGVQVGGLLSVGGLEPLQNILHRAPRLRGELRAKPSVPGAERVGGGGWVHGSALGEAREASRPELEDVGD